MKQCRSSVVPSPSRMSTPLTSFQSFQVATGSTSPADTQKRSDAVSSLFPCRTYSTSALNTAGTPKKIVGR